MSTGSGDGGIVSERPLTTMAGGFLLPEGPRWHDGALWFCDMLRGNLHRMVGETVETVASFDHPTCVGFRPNGDVLVADADVQQLHTLRDGKVVSSLDLSGIAHD